MDHQRRKSDTKLVGLGLSPVGEFSSQTDRRFKTTHFAQAIVEPSQSNQPRYHRSVSKKEKSRSLYNPTLQLTIDKEAGDNGMHRSPMAGQGGFQRESFAEYLPIIENSAGGNNAKSTVSSPDGQISKKRLKPSSKKKTQTHLQAPTYSSVRKQSTLMKKRKASQLLDRQSSQLLNQDLLALRKLETSSPKKSKASPSKKMHNDKSKNKAKTPIFTRFKTFHLDEGKNQSINEDVNEGLNSEDVSPNIGGAPASKLESVQMVCKSPMPLTKEFGLDMTSVKNIRRNTSYLSKKRHSVVNISDLENLQSLKKITTYGQGNSQPKMAAQNSHKTDTNPMQLIESPDPLLRGNRHLREPSTGGEIGRNFGQQSDVSNIRLRNQQESSTKKESSNDPTFGRPPDTSTSVVQPESSYTRRINMSANNRDLVSASMEKFNSLQQRLLKDSEREEIKFLKEKARAEKSKFDKEKAILEQRIELLTKELHEADERQKNLKQKYEAMIKALKFKLKDSSNEETPIAEEIDSCTDPSISVSLTASKREYLTTPSKQILQPRQMQELSDMKMKKEESDKKAENLSHLVKKLEESLETNRIQVRTQENLLLKKEEELIQLRSSTHHQGQDLKRYEHMLKESQSQALISASAMKEIEKAREEAKQKVQQQVQITSSLLQEKEKEYNEQVIQHQKEVYSLNAKIEEHRSLASLKDLRCFELEKQVRVLESNLQSMKREREKIESGLASKLDELITENENLRGLLLTMRGQSEGLREKQLGESMTLAVRDERNAPLTEIDGETNKFITSPESSVMMNIGQAAFDNLAAQSQQDLPLDKIGLVRNIIKQCLEEEKSAAAPDHRRSLEQFYEDEIMKDGFPLSLNQSSSKAQESAPRQASSKDSKKKPGSKVGATATKYAKSLKAAKAVNKLHSKSVKELGLSKEPVGAGRTSGATGSSGAKLPLSPVPSDAQVEDMNSLRRLVSDLRARYTRLNVQYNDLRKTSKDEISKLKSKIKVEYMRRLDAQEDKVEKSSNLLQELAVRDKKIADLATEVVDLKLEKSEIESNLNDTQMNSSRMMGFNRSQYPQSSLLAYGVTGGTSARRRKTLRSNSRSSFNKLRNSQRSLYTKSDDLEQASILNRKKSVPLVDSILPASVLQAKPEPEPPKILSFDAESQANPVELDMNPPETAQTDRGEEKQKNMFGDEISSGEADIYRRISTEQKLEDIMLRKDFQEPLPLETESDSNQLSKEKTKKNRKIKIGKSLKAEIMKRTKSPMQQAYFAIEKAPETEISNKSDRDQRSQRSDSSTSRDHPRISNNLVRINSPVQTNPPEKLMTMQSLEKNRFEPSQVTHPASFSLRQKLQDPSFMSLPGSARRNDNGLSPNPSGLSSARDLPPFDQQSREKQSSIDKEKEESKFIQFSPNPPMNLAKDGLNLFSGCSPGNCSSGQKDDHSSEVVIGSNSQMMIPEAQRPEVRPVLEAAKERQVLSLGESFILTPGSTSGNISLRRSPRDFKEKLIPKEDYRYAEVVVESDSDLEDQIGEESKDNGLHVQEMKRQVVDSTIGPPSGMGLSASGMGSFRLQSIAQVNVSQNSFISKKGATSFLQSFDRLQQSRAPEQQPLPPHQSSRANNVKMQQFLQNRKNFLNKQQ